MSLAHIAITENLINCWIREGGATEYVDSLHMRIPLSGISKKLDVYFENQTLLRDVRLSQLVYMDGWQIGAQHLAKLLAEELLFVTRATYHKTPDWQENFENSLDVLEGIFSRVNPKEPEKSFTLIESEQSLWHGHRFHPSPKSRIGFSQEDLQRYSPEWCNSFKLHYLSVKQDDLVMRGDNAFLNRWMSADEGFIVLPLHPWQAKKTLQSPAVKEAIANRTIVDLGEMGADYFPTSSVRTLYEPNSDLFVKTSLGVRITNCVRLNLPQELEALSHLRKVVRKYVPTTHSFRVLDEPLSLDLAPKYDEHVGVIFREGVATERLLGAEPLLAGFLFGDGAFSCERLRGYLDQGDEGKFFESYCRGIISPILSAFFEQGIMFEPHLQNILVARFRDQSFRFLQRDLDNVKIVEGSLAFDGLRDMPHDIRKDVTYTPAVAWQRLVYCLIVNHLAEVIATLARVRKPSHSLEYKLWMILREELLAFDHRPEIQTLLDHGALSSKKNLFCRVTRTPDKLAPFAELPNPMVTYAAKDLSA
jgi:siderophore synthetase component